MLVFWILRQTFEAGRMASLILVMHSLYLDPQYFLIPVFCVSQNILRTYFMSGTLTGEGLKMSDTGFLWSIFSNLDWRVRLLKTWYEILCVGL